ncbi:dihydrodipicolinate synthase family protein [Actinomadura sp. HBU206391]|uniref:dihydrodipicolinate synthase family protein n=1 Tax=Actinomadura sp. HBU206391 TaxID=2731692 RepID=UPI0016507E03|nr:dihydrodipicolinate synthase family protein [Actinomadura sp. HBU206391]MBC6460399.1 dihydrodipicolinate synthase family protein [Actinomadura sp. HBU206391]
MRALSPDALTGTWATVLLPIGADDRIDWERLSEQVHELVAAGVDGVYTNGSSGEFWAQSEEEFDRLSSMVADVCERAGVPFQIGAAHPSPQTALGRLRRARDLSPGAIQVILPDWFAPSDQETLAFLRRMADEAAPVPLVLYNPPHAKRVLTAPGLSRLLDSVPETVGVKVADGDQTWYDAMAPVSGRVALFVPGHHLATGYGRGAAGAYSNVACLNPRAAVWWWAQITTDQAAAEAVEIRLRSFLDTEVLPLQRRYGYCNAALDKLLAAIGAWTATGTRMRWPYQGVPEADLRRLRAVARDRLPEFTT